MATYPPHGLTDWDDDLKVYIDTAIDERADAGDATVVANAAAAAAATTAAAAASVPKALVDAKGDLIVATADNTVARKAVGPNNSILRADSGDATGVKWGPVLPEISRNLVSNPSLEIDTSGYSTTASYWSNAPTSFTRESPGLGIGTWLGYIVASAASNLQGVQYPLTGLKANTAYRVSVNAYSISGGAPTLNVRDMTNNINAVSATVLSGTSGRMTTVIRTGATGAVALLIAITSPVSPTAAAVFYFDGLMVTEGTELVNYFDGGTPGCYWTGTPNASESVKTLLSDADVFTVDEMPELARNIFRDPAPVKGANFGSSQSPISIVSAPNSPSGWAARATDTSAPSTPYVISAGSLMPTARPGLYYISAYIKTPQAPVVAALEIRWQDISGTTITTEGVLTSQPTGGMVGFKATAPAGTFNASLIAYYSSGGRTLADPLELGSISITPGGKPAGYFSGDTPGCYWTGTPNASESVKALLSDADVFTVDDMPELARNLVKTTTVNWFGGGGVGNVSRSPLFPSDFRAFRKTWTTAPTTTSQDTGVVTSQPYPAVAAGRAYSFAADVKASRAIPMTIYVDFRNDANASVGSFASINYPADTSLRTVTLSNVVAPAGATNVYMSVYPNYASNIMWQVGDTLDVGNMIVNEGPVALPFFNGDAPGCRWLGAPNASESVKNIPTKADHDLLVWLDAGRAQGTGSPEGKVIAKVGTRYVDTLATTGAIEWIKASGTGNTGWKVVYGDTGWRDVTMAWKNPSDWDGVEGRAVARRVNSTIELAWDARSTANRSPFTPLILPSGWQPLLGFYLGRGYRADENIYLAVLGPVHYVYTATGDYRSGQSTFTTVDPWPTTLPGTPA